MQAEKYDNEVMQRIAFLDPLHGLDKGSPINLPLTAFCYLVRRLAVSL
jgi:ubiquitin-conjugating enzyme E2 Q